MSIIRVFRNFSIRWKLAILYAVSICIMLLLASKLIDLNLHSSLAKEENDFVNDRFHLFRAIIGEQKNYLDIIRDNIEWEGKNVANPEYYLRILDENRHLILETPGMANNIPLNWVPLPSTSEAGAKHDVIRKARNGRFYLLKSDSVQLTPKADKLLVIQLALDVTSEETIDAANHKRIDLFLLLGVVLFTGGGLLVIGRVLKPLDDMIAVANRITAEQITERVDPTNLPRELQSYAKAFNSMLARLEEALTRLSHCASNLAHELRTPVNNIMGEAEIALSQERTPEEYKNVLESAIDEGNRLTRIIESLLLLARAENPATRIDRSLFDPLAEIKNIYDFLGPMAEEKEAVLTCKGNGLLDGDPLLFRRVVMNLVTNSLKYSDRGVTVSITVRRSEDSSTDIIIQDTGFGIEEKDLPRIFDRFYRADASRPYNPEGSGLGLSIVKAIMDLHGGFVTVNSKVGQGTTFILRFPTSPTKE